MQAILNRPLRKRPKIYPLVPNPLDLCDESLQYHDDNYCVCRSIGAVLNKDWAEIADSFSDIIGDSWRDVGISSAQVLQWCEVHDHTAHVFWQSKMIESRKGSKKALCWSVMGGTIDLKNGSFDSISVKVNVDINAMLELQPSIQCT